MSAIYPFIASSAYNQSAPPVADFITVRATTANDVVSSRNSLSIFPTAVTGTHAINRQLFTSVGLHRISFSVYRPSGNSSTTGLRVSNGNTEFFEDRTPSADQWTDYVLYGVVKTLTGAGFNGSFLFISLLAGAANSFLGVATDFIAISNLHVEHLSEMPVNSFVPIGRLISGGV
jgi:hypothetical protein